MLKPRPRRRHGCALPQLILPLALACATSTYHNEGSIMSNRTLAHHYLFQEIDFLARQSMILGNFHGDADKATSTSSAEDKIQRLRFLEKSLLIELDYIRRLKEMLNNPSDILHKSTANESCSVEATGCGIDEMRFRRDTPREIIANTISGATWPTLAPPSSKNETIYLIDHDYDIDRASERGFVGMYDDFDCYGHAIDQNKPMYTPEMWRKLWEVFRDSTLFPFPIPKAHECPQEPFYAAYTTDGKGRGVFASRNITKGSLVHPGHPNTVFFLDSKSWHHFVSSLPKMIACDTMEWVWQQDLTDSGNLVLCLNMDKAAFFNHGGTESRCNIAMKEPTSLDFYAATDIQIGQELLYDYDELGGFEFDTSAMN